MKSIFFFILLCAFAPIPVAYSQAQPGQTSNVQIYVSSGSIISFSPLGSLDDFRQLVPNNPILEGDYSGYRQDGGGLDYQSAFAFGVHLTPFKNEDGTRRNMGLRVGFSHFGTSPLSVNFNRNTTTPADTLVSSSTGRTVLLDTARYQGMNSSINTRHLYLDLALIFTSNWESRWTGYFGAGLSLGITTKNEVSSTRYEDVFLQMRNNDFFGSERVDGSFEQSVQSRSTGFGTMINVPLGIDWRLSRAHPFWSNVSLFAEWRPHLHLLWLPDQSTIAMPGSFSLFGLRVRA